MQIGVTQISRSSAENSAVGRPGLQLKCLQEGSLEPEVLFIISHFTTVEVEFGAARALQGCLLSRKAHRVLLSLVVIDLEHFIPRDATVLVIARTEQFQTQNKLYNQHCADTAQAICLLQTAHLGQEL